MNKTLMMLIVLAALVLVLIAPLSPLTAEASGRVCPSPGGGYAGALNMLNAGDNIVNHENAAANGQAGMGTAVTNSGC